MQMLLFLVDTLVSGAELVSLGPVLTALDFLSGAPGNCGRRLAKRGAKYRYQKWLQHAIYVAKVLRRIWCCSEQLGLCAALLAGHFGVVLPLVVIVVVAAVFVCVIEWLEWRRRNVS